MQANTPTATGLPRLRHRWAALAGLLVLSPISAEYLVGYGDSTDKPLELLAGLVVLTPLYGTVAVLIREVTRRTGRGWPTILLLAAAFGVLQAGVVDQALFFRDFLPGDPEWATNEPATYIPGLGIDAASLLNYVGGHVIWSITAPIVVIECGAPRIANRRWLGRPGIAAMLLLFAVGAVAIHLDTTKDSDASAAQVGGALGVVIALVVAGFLVRPKAAASAAKAPSWWLVGAVTAAILLANQLLPANWLSVTINILALIALGQLLLRWSRRQGWGRPQLLAAAGAALLVRSGISFLVEPLGNVDTTMKLVVNAATFAGVVALLSWAARRQRQTIS